MATLITAIEAGERSLSRREQNVNSAIFQIDTIIRQTADKGLYTVQFDFRSIGLGDKQQPVVDDVKDELSNTGGYTVELVRQFKAGDEVFEIIQITWEA